MAAPQLACSPTPADGGRIRLRQVVTPATRGVRGDVHAGRSQLLHLEREDLGANDADADRYAVVIGVVRDLDASVVAVQDVIAADQAAAMAQLARLADLSEMTATVSAGGSGEPDSHQPTYAGGAGGNRFATGWLWRRRRRHRRGPGHLPGVRRQRRRPLADEGRPEDRWGPQHCGAVTRGPARTATPGQRSRASRLRTDKQQAEDLGSAANTIGFARAPDGTGGYRYYDDDPYAGQPWQPGCAHTCTATTDASCEIIAHQADRTASRILAEGGPMTSPLPSAPQGTDRRAPPHRRARHGPAHRLSPHATTAMIKQIARHEVDDSPQAWFANDHLPSSTFWTGSR